MSRSAVRPTPSRSPRSTRATLPCTRAAWAALFVAAAAAAPVRAAEPAGDELFAKHCATCHGIDGEGGGPAARAMAVTVPNLRTLAQRNGGAYPSEQVAAYIDGREAVAAHGDRVMPVWGDFLEQSGDASPEKLVQARIAALVSFIERLQYR